MSCPLSKWSQSKCLVEKRSTIASYKTKYLEKSSFVQSKYKWMYTYVLFKHELLLACNVDIRVMITWTWSRGNERTSHVNVKWILAFLFLSFLFKHDGLPCSSLLLSGHMHMTFISCEITNRCIYVNKCPNHLIQCFDVKVVPWCFSVSETECLSVSK